jgi:glutamate dehydrogenase (NADP+)
LIDDKGATQVNRGFRIQMNSAIGPYKGDSFSPTCEFEHLKFLALSKHLKTALPQWVVERWS